MSTSWRTVPLGEIINLQRGFDLPTQNRRDGHVPIVSSSGVSGTHSQARVTGPGVVTGRYGTIGQIFYVTEDYWPLNTTLFVQDFKGNDPRYIYYLLHTLDYQAHNDKSSVPGVNRNHLHQINVWVAPLPEQRAIAHILGTLDDKIDLNRRMNQTLEAIARALFRSWFVDFDPVRAKIEGRQPEGMDAETAALYPDQYDDSPIGPIPVGWESVTLAEHVEVAKGLSYKGEGLSKSEGLPMHNLNSINEGGGYKYEGIKYYSGEFKPQHLVKPGDVIVANTEQGFGYLLIGFPAIVPRFYGSQGLFSHHIFCVRPRVGSPLQSHYLYHLLMVPIVRAQVVACTNGTTVNMLSADGLRVPRFALPPRVLIDHFESIAAPIFEIVENNHQESRTLAALRDTLLPRLLSGELRVPDAARLAEAAS